MTTTKTPIQSTKSSSRVGPSGRAIPEPDDYHELRKSLSYQDMIERAQKATSSAHAYHWYRAAKEKSEDDENRRTAQIRELASLESHLRDHAYTAAELVERFGLEEETAEETLVRVAVEVINDLHSPMFTTYEENRARCIERLRPLREYVDALARSLKARRAAATVKKERATKPTVLTGQQIAMLTLLSSQPDPITPHELMVLMGSAKSYNAVRAQANNLAERGLATRTKSLEGLLYGISPAGIEALQHNSGDVIDMKKRRKK